MADSSSSLKVQWPVPSDIDIAQSVDPLHVSRVAERAGVLDHELHLYGRNKAKIDLDVLKRFFPF